MLAKLKLSQNHGLYYIGIISLRLDYKGKHVLTCLSLMVLIVCFVPFVIKL